MREKSTIFFVVISFLLASCTAASDTPAIVATENLFIPAPVIPGSTAYPLPEINESTTNPYPGTTPSSTLSAYPPPASVSTVGTAIPPSGFEPLAKDATLKRDQVSLDISNSQLVVIIGEPVIVQVILKGNMSDPCHSLRAVVTPADANNNISIEAYTVVDITTPCATVLQPFTITIPLGSYSGGTYKVTANGELLGQFNGIYAQQPNDDKLTRGEVNLDMTLSKLVFLRQLSYQEAVNLQGNLPDPCHQLRIALTPADTQGKISLDVYSVYDPQATCTMGIVPFNVILPLGNNPAGHYSVNVNTLLLGEFDK